MQFEEFGGAIILENQWRKAPGTTVYCILRDFPVRFYFKDLKQQNMNLEELQSS